MKETKYYITINNMLVELTEEEFKLHRAKEIEEDRIRRLKAKAEIEALTGIIKCECQFGTRGGYIKIATPKGVANYNSDLWAFGATNAQKQNLYKLYKALEDRVINRRLANLTRTGNTFIALIDVDAMKDLYLETSQQHLKFGKLFLLEEEVL